MRDVAARAGVSVKTVSRVVNAEPHTRPEVVARVQAAISELGWAPSVQARSLRTGRAGLLAVTVAGLRRPALAALVEALVLESDRRGVPVTVEPVGDDATRFGRTVASRGRLVDAVVHVGPAGPGPLWPGWSAGALPPLPDDVRGERPLVLLQPGPVETPADQVCEDVVAAVRLLAHHLGVMGRSRPVLLGPDRGWTAWSAAGAQAGPSPALSGALVDVGVDPAGVPVVPLGALADRAAGARAAREALARVPGLDALVCVSDEVALGALHALTEAGVRVPDDVALVGYDALDDGRWSTPTLTTVDPGAGDLARAALDLVHDRLAGRAGEAARRVVLPAQLLRRESTQGVR